MIHSLKQNQHGIVSIFVAVMFVLITSLITTSFAFLMRREQQQVLDQQLSTQAFYAAESGVNDAVKALETGGLGDITQCGQQIGTTSKELATGFQRYTCILVNTTPGEVVIDELPGVCPS